MTDTRLPPGRYPRVCGRCDHPFTLVCEPSGRAVTLAAEGPSSDAPSGGSARSRSPLPQPPSAPRKSGPPSVGKSGPLSAPLKLGPPSVVSRAGPPSSAGKPPPTPADEPLDIWDRTEPTSGFNRRAERASGPTSGPRSRASSGPNTSFKLKDTPAESSQVNGQTTADLRSPGAPTHGPRTRGPTSHGRPAEPPADVPPEVGGYQVRKRLGENDQGAVYAATDPLTGSAVELMVFHRTQVDDPSLAARIGYAAHLAAQLDAPNITRVREFGLDGDLMYMVTDAVVRRTLADELVRGGPLPPATAVGFILQAAHGLDYLHRQGIVHRRVNPNTLLLDAGSVVKVSDWGTIRTASLSTGSSAGARFPLARYLAPELAADPSLRRPRSDVYGLGWTLYTLLTGLPPDSAATGPASGLRADTVPAGLRAVIAKATAAAASNRYMTTMEMAAALEEWLVTQADGPPAPTEEEAAAYRRAARRAARLSGWGLGGWLAALVPAVGTLAALGPLDGHREIGWAAFAAGWAAALGGLAAAAVASTSELAGLVRKWAAGLGWGDRAVALVVITASAVGLAWGPSPLLGAVGLIVGGGCGVLYAVLASSAAERGRAGPVSDAREVLKGLRRRGCSELAVRAFAVDAAGRRWEPLYRQLFGAAAAERMRAEVGRGGVDRPIPIALCDPLAAALTARVRAVSRAAFFTLQRRRVAAKGLTGRELTDATRDTTERLTAEADRVRRAADNPALNENYRTAFDGYGRPKAGPTDAGWLGTAVTFLVHPRWRVLLGGLLVGGGLLWASAAVTPRPPAGLGLDTPTLFLAWLAPEYMPPLLRAWLPPWAGGTFASANAVVAGVILLLSAALRSRVWVLAAVAVAGVTLFGHRLGAVPLADRIGPSFVSLFAATILGVYVLVMMWDWQRPPRVKAGATA